MKYVTKHHILTPDRQHDLGAEVSDSNFANKAEVERLLALGAIAPLRGTEGYQEPYIRPDQGSDPTPRGVGSPDWYAGALTPEEIDAQIAALQAQRDSAVASQQQQQAARDASDKASKPSKASKIETPPAPDNPPSPDNPPAA